MKILILKHSTTYQAAWWNENLSELKPIWFFGSIEWFKFVYSDCPCSLSTGPLSEESGR